MFALVCQSQISIAQAKDAVSEEHKTFYLLMRQSEEFQQLKVEIDSLNSNTSNIPYELAFGIDKKTDPSSNPEKYLYGRIDMKLSIGFIVKSLLYVYDRHSKKIINVEKVVFAQVETTTAPVPQTQR